MNFKRIPVVFLEFYCESTNKIGGILSYCGHYSRSFFHPPISSLLGGRYLKFPIIYFVSTKKIPLWSFFWINIKVL